MKYKICESMQLVIATILCFFYLISPAFAHNEEVIIIGAFIGLIFFICFVFCLISKASKRQKIIAVIPLFVGIVVVFWLSHIPDYQANFLLINLAGLVNTFLATGFSLWILKR